MRLATFSAKMQHGRRTRMVGKIRAFCQPSQTTHGTKRQSRQILVGGQAKRKDSFSSSSIRRQPTTALLGIGTSISFKPSLPLSTPYFRNPKMRHGERRRRRWVVEEPSVSLAHVLGPGAKAASQLGTRPNSLTRGGTVLVDHVRPQHMMQKVKCIRYE